MPDTPPTQKTRKPASYHVLEQIELADLADHLEGRVWRMLTTGQPVVATSRKAAIKAAAKADDELKAKAQAHARLAVAAGDEPDPGAFPTREDKQPSTAPVYWAVPAAEFQPRKRLVTTIEIDRVD
jgi:hypothetical protein